MEKRIIYNVNPFPETPGCPIFGESILVAHFDLEGFWVIPEINSAGLVLIKVDIAS